MDDRQGFKSASGVVLHRRSIGESGLLLSLFLKGLGLVSVAARGAASGKMRFGGGTEPLMWGNFGLYNGRSGGYHLKSADVVDDLLKLRSRPESIFTAIRWVRLLMRHLPAGHPADDLLANLYWNMKLLDRNVFPPEAVEWRFLWRWLKNQGLAPDLFLCARCGANLNSAFWSGEGLCCGKCLHHTHQSALTVNELLFLRAIAEMKAPELENLIKKQEITFPERRFFTDANRRLESLLMEV